MKASIVIPVFNKAELTDQCLRSIHESGGPIHEIIVVDNGSTDKTPEVLRGYGVRVLRHEENKGYGVALNDGAALASAEVLVLPSNDTIAHQGWLELLLETLEDEMVGITGAFGGFLTSDYRCARLVTAPKRDVDYIEGSVLACRRTVWDRLKGFSDWFAPAYCEDTDLSIRARRLGYRTVVTPRVPIEHLGGQTSSEVYTAEKFNKNLQRHLRLLADLYGSPYHSIDRWRIPAARVCIGGSPAPDWFVTMPNTVGGILGRLPAKRKIVFDAEITAERFEEGVVQSEYMIICHPDEKWSQPLLDNLCQLFYPNALQRGGTLLPVSGRPPELRVVNMKKSRFDFAAQKITVEGAEQFDVVSLDEQRRPIVGWAVIESLA